jgi:ribonucleoside-diphosphate reductase beta chain
MSLTSSINNEPILSQDNNRMRLYPIVYQDIWSLYKDAFAAFWIPEEVSLIDDIKDWNSGKLDDDEKHFVLTVLSFFSASDFIVNENLDNNFCEQITVPEYRMFVHFQEMMEDVHTQMYQTLIQSLVQDEKQRDILFNGIKNYSSIKRKADWARKWIAEGDFVQRLVAFSCVEGIFFSGSFCSIFWLKKIGLMPGLCHSNELIARDEGMHRDMGCLIYRNHITGKMDSSVVKNIIRDAVEVESAFVDECLPYKLKGMNADLMKQYIQFVADHLSVSLIEEKIFDVENPFPWMNLISLEGKKNFFEKKVSQYAKQSVITDKEENEVRFDEDF